MFQGLWQHWLSLWGSGCLTGAPSGDFCRLCQQAGDAREDAGEARRQPSSRWRLCSHTVPSSSRCRVRNASTVSLSPSSDFWDLLSASVTYPSAPSGPLTWLHRSSWASLRICCGLKAEHGAHFSSLSLQVGHEKLSLGCTPEITSRTESVGSVDRKAKTTCILVLFELFSHHSVMCSPWKGLLFWLHLFLLLCLCVCLLF